MTLAEGDSPSLVQCTMNRNMFSAIIECGEDERALARTLSVLVPAAVDGLLRDVAVLAGMPADHRIVQVCEHAGCDLRPRDALRQVIADCRAEWLVFLEAGAVLEPGWTEALRVHAMGSSTAVRFTRSPRAKRTWLKRLTGLDRGLPLGVVTTKRQALVLAASGTTPDDLARRARAIRIPATILPYAGLNAIA